MMLMETGLILLGTSGYMVWRSYTEDSKRLRNLFRAGGLMNRDGVMPTLKESRKTKYGKLLRLSLPLGLSSYHFIERQDAIEQALNARVEISYSNHHLFIKIFEKELGTVDYISIDAGRKLLCGMTHGQELVVLDLEKEDQPHLLIGGNAGSGKSTAMRVMITNLILWTDVELYLIDCKYGVEFGIFERCEQVAMMGRTKDDAIAILEALCNQAQERYELLESKGCVDIKEYNKRYKKKMRHIGVFIDEFAMLRGKGKGGNDAIEHMITLSAIGRACGIHLIAATQRPDKDIFEGKIKANFTSVVGFRTIDEVNSRIIIGEPGLEDCRGRGHGLMRKEAALVEIQTMNLTPERARQLVKSHYVEKKKDQDKAEDTSGAIQSIEQLED